MIEYTPQNSMYGYYYEMLNKHSKQFRELIRLKKSELINRVGIKKWISNNKEGRLVEHQKDIARMKLNKLELAYWLYHLNQDI
jgi:hypothetical protein